MHDQQIFKDGDEVYVWIYDPVPFKTFCIGLLLGEYQTATLFPANYNMCLGSLQIFHLGSEHQSHWSLCWLCVSLGTPYLADSLCRVLIPQNQHIWAEFLQEPTKAHSFPLKSGNLLNSYILCLVVKRYWPFCFHGGVWFVELKFRLHRNNILKRVCFLFQFWVLLLYVYSHCGHQRSDLVFII